MGKEDNLEALRRSRSGTKSYFTTLAKKWKELVDSCPNKVPLRHLCERRMKEFEKNRERYEEIHFDIEPKVPEDAPDFADHEDYMDKWNTVVDEISACIDAIDRATAKRKDDEMKKEMQEKYDNQLQEQLKVLAGNHPICPDRMQLKLQPLEIPTFDGNYLDWPHFHSLYKSAVHDTTLPNVQKLNLLASKLTGPASLFVEGLRITGDHYEFTWNALEEHYQNHRAVRTAHLDQLFNIPKLTHKSASELQTFTDTCSRCHVQLEKLNFSIDDVLLHVLTRKLDPETREAWELAMADEKQPEIRYFIKFMQKRSKAAAMTNPPSTNVQSKPQKSSTSYPKAHSSQSKSHAHASTKPRSINVATKALCKICNKEDHLIIMCPKFKSMSIMDRRAAISSSKLCFNCFRSDHLANKCPSPKRCKSCNGVHHTLLHNDSPPRPTEEKKDPQVHVQTESTHPPTDRNEATALTVQSNLQVLLATAIVSVRNSQNREVPCRALVDLGAQANFVSESCAKRLGLPREKSALSFRGISKGANKVQQSISIIIKSNYEDYSTQVESFVVDSIADSLPSYPSPSSRWPHIEGLQLADPDFHIPGDIDILLSAAVYADILKERIKRGTTNTPIAQETSLGWILFGRVPHTQFHAFVATATMDNPVDFLPKFWELEEVPDPTATIANEPEAEEHFRSTYSREPDGRYMIRLPFTSNPPALGESRFRAEGRLKMMERRFNSQPDLQKQYSDFMSEYLSLGHMNKVIVSKDEDPSKSFYLPHHAVIKKDSATTKCRVVFDASCKSSSGVSLNDILIAGPTVQDDIFTLLVRFRSHQVAMCADITKMYRQFLCHPDDRPYQRIVWRESSQDPIEVYELNTVTYGTASAPFQAIRCLQQLAEDEASQFPLASRVTLNDYYVDNLLTGCESVEQALLIQDELLRMMPKGQLELRQWSSNSPAVATAVPPALRDASEEVGFESEEAVPSVSTLGIKWRTNDDVFTYKFAPKGPAGTKREVLSAIARIFDPLGWLAPVVITAKAFMKTLWKLNLDWDDPVPMEVLQVWLALESQLPDLRSLSVPRCLTFPNPLSYELHGFGDASKVAYAAAVYLKTTYEDGSSLVRLICSKSRVSPAKELTIPKLELCAALLVTELSLAVKNALMISMSSIHLWSDSSVVLCWIKDSPHRWKPFVQNRVKKIQQHLPEAWWSHVPGIDNPADLASRGVTPKKLLTSDLWWSGPNWLSQQKVPYFPHGPYVDPEALTEQRSQKIPRTTVLVLRKDPSVLPSVSSYWKLVRIIAWCLRVTNKVAAKKRPSTPYLSISELSRAELAIVKHTQASEFCEEIKALLKKKLVHKKSQLKGLNPFLDEDGLLRVGGRLRHTDLSLSQRHPLILPPVCLFTKLLIIEEHERLLHGGTSLVLSSLHQRYWLLNGRNAVRFVLRKCLSCYRHKAKAATQLMGDLPKSRVTPSPPFLRTGVDYAGPIDISDRRGRGAKTTKGYIVLFICMATKAIHLELATELTTIKFLDAFRRFISTRGRPSEMNSDCGTNFQGAVNHMKDVFTFLRSSSASIQDELAKEKITWNFNPPAAPTFGGLWEAGVKSVKYHLKRVLGMMTLTYEDFLTVLKQIEGTLNSRPLIPIPTDSEDPSVLTPSHFLLGRPVTALPDEDYTDVPNNRLQRWAMQQKMFQSFWSRWSREYLHRLQKRPKWWSMKSSLKENDVVLVIDERYPPNQWPLGRIMKTHPGEDGLVRVVTVKTARGEFQRPINKVAPLPFDEDEEDML